MNNNHKVQEITKLKKKAIELFSDAIAKVLLKFKFSRGDLYNSIDEKLVLQARKQDPNASIVTIAIRTSIDRRYVSKYLKGKMPVSKPDKMAIILEDLRWTAHKYYSSNKLPKLGYFRTFQSICEQRASGTLTYMAILEEFIKLGNIKDLGNKVEIIDPTFTRRKNEVDFSNLTATQINRIVDTLIFNSSIKSKKSRLLERSIYSTQIPPHQYGSLHSDLEKLFYKYYQEIEDTFLHYESNVEMDTYPQYGVSLFEYKTEE